MTVSAIWRDAGRFVSSPGQRPFVGLRGPAPGRRALFGLPLAWFTGGLLGLAIEGLPTFPIPAMSFLTTGVLVAADLKLSPQVDYVHRDWGGFASWGPEW